MFVAEKLLQRSIFIGIVRAMVGAYKFHLATNRGADHNYNDIGNSRAFHYSAGLRLARQFQSPL